MVHRISVAEHAKRKRSAIHQNLHRPKRTRTDSTFAEVLNAVLSFMKPEVGNLSWVANETIARTTPYGKRTVAHYLTAATLIGAITVAYRTARAAHRGTIRFYPNYTENTYGKTFSMLIKAELDNNGRVKPKTLNFYRLNRNWIGYSMVPEYLPDWMLEVIRLCATKTAANVRAAKRLAAIHHIRCQTKDKKASANEGVNITKYKLCVYASALESASANEGVPRPCVLSTRKQGNEGPVPSSASENASANDPADTLPDSPVRLESVIVNDPARTTTHKLCVYALTPANAIVNDPARGGQVVPRKEHGDEGSAPSSAIEEKQEPGAGKPVLAVSGLKAGPGHSEVEPSVTPENDAQYQTDREQALRDRETRWLASEEGQKAHQRYLKIRAECLAQMKNPGRASSPGPSCGGVPPQPGPIVVEPPVTPEDATNPVTVRQSWGPRRATAQQDLGPASRPGPSCGGVPPQPGPIVIEPPVTPEQTPPPSRPKTSVI